MADTLPDVAREERLDSVIVEYLESVERGESPDPGPWLARHPELAELLRDFFAAEAQFDRMVLPLRPNSSFAATPAAPSTPSDARRGSPFPLRSIDDYELLSELGRGGMGVIYKARQRSLNRLVAIKMLRSAEWATPAERLRFRWEAETIATLDHPNIVPIYEVGEVPSADGTRLPFFSMKLIEGQNLAEARGRFRNNWRGIAQLLRLVTRAVEHAHQRGVLHRDLKPANVLLQVDPDVPAGAAAHRASGLRLGASFITPHITDFGLARRTQQTRGATLPGAIVGTPAYLAPELTRGHEFATTASDTYSLGVILYELLTGSSPFQARTPLETIQLVAANAAAPPRQVNPAVPQDLETICLKCLETEPGRRYPSADKLAEDLENYLAHRPITARPIGSIKRFGRWCRRQPVIAGLSAALLLGALVGTPLILWNWRRAVEQEKIAVENEGRANENARQARENANRAVENERVAEKRLEEARRERDRADGAFSLADRAIADTFRLLASEAGDESASSQSRKEVLANGLKYYREFVARHKDDPKLRREVARAMGQMGDIAGRLGPLRDAVESYRTAIALFRSLVKEYPGEAELREQLGRLLDNLGSALSAMNRLDEALVAFDESIAVRAEILKDRPGDAQALTFQAQVWMNRGVALQVTGDWRRVLESARRGQAILTENGLTAKDPRLAIMMLLNIAQAEDQLDLVDDAIRDAREAVRLAQAMLKASPGSFDARLMVAYTTRLAGNIYRWRGKLEEAKESLDTSEKFMAEIHRQRPRVAEYAWNLSLCYEDLAELASKQNRPREQLQALLKAEALLKALVERDADSRHSRVNLARIERRLADLHQKLGNVDETRKAFEQARIHLTYLLANNLAVAGTRSEMAKVCHQLGVAYARLNKHAEAAEAAKEAAKHYRILLEKSPGDRVLRRNFCGALGNRANAERELGHLPEALKATEERASLRPDDAPALYDAATDFGRTFDAAQRAGAPAAAARDAALKNAIQTLRQAIKAGYKDPAKIGTDQRFALMRETPEFQAFLQEVSEAGK